MVSIDRERTIPVFQHRVAIVSVISRRVCHTFWVQGGRKVHIHHVPRILVVIVTVCHSQSTVVCFLDVAQKATWIHDLFYSCVNFVVKVVDQAQGVNLKGL